MIIMVTYIFLMLPFRKCHNYKDGQLQHDLNAYGSEFKRLVIANNLNLMVNFLASEPKNVQKTFWYWIEHADKKLLHNNHEEYCV